MSHVQESVPFSISIRLHGKSKALFEIRVELGHGKGDGLRIEVCERCLVDGTQLLERRAFSRPAAGEDDVALRRRRRVCSLGLLKLPALPGAHALEDGLESRTASAAEIRQLEAWFEEDVCA